MAVSPPPRRHRRLGRHERLDVVVGEDRIDIEAAAEAIGLAAGKMRDLREVEHGRQFRQVLHHMQRRRAVQAIAGRGPRLGKRGEQHARRRTGGVDLDAASAGPGEGLGGLRQRREVGRGQHLAGLMVEEQRREGRDAGEAAAVEAIQPIGDGGDIGGGKAALVAPVEGVALGMDAGEQVLHAPGGPGPGRRLLRLGLVEDRPVVRLEHPCRTIGLGAGDLLEMAEMADFHAGAVDRLRAGHVDGDRAVDAAAHDRPAGRTRPAELLGHGKGLQAEPRRLVLEDAGIALDRVEIDDIGIGRDAALAVKRLGGFDEAGIAAAKNVEKHAILLSGTFRAATRRLRRG